MKIRLKFEKLGRLKYIGHLDLLHVFNRAIKSAKLPVLYSQGFNPHMLIAFATPLSLGIESVAEYVDIGFEDGVNIEALRDCINSRFPDDLRITGVIKLGEPYKRIASSVTAASYDFKGLPEITSQQIDSFLSLQKFEVMKKTKRKNEIADIRKDIISIKKAEDGISAVLSCGSFDNLKPTLFIESFLGFCETDVPLYKIGIKRTEILSGEIPLSESL